MTMTTILLERLTALIQQSVRTEAAEHDLLPIHIQVLRYLSMANRYSDSPIAISEYFGITRGTISQTLAVLERKGLIVKESDPDHGKRIHLKLTREGKALLKNSWTERLEAAAESIDKALLNDVLQQLLTAMQRMNKQQAFGVCQDCAHFLRHRNGAQCGLTGEALQKEQSSRLCREWKTPE